MDILGPFSALKSLVFQPYRQIIIRTRSDDVENDRQKITMKNGYRIRKASVFKAVFIGTLRDSRVPGSLVKRNRFLLYSHHPRNGFTHGRVALSGDTLPHDRMRGHHRKRKSDERIQNVGIRRWHGEPIFLANIYQYKRDERHLYSDMLLFLCAESNIKKWSEYITLYRP